MTVRKPACGAVKHVTGAAPLVCVREAGHAGQHHTTGYCGFPLARWPSVWTEADEAAYRFRMRRADETQSQSHVGPHRNRR